MHFSEDDLREALRRKDPGESLTKKVMAGIASQQPQSASAPKLSDRLRELWRQLKLRPVLAGSLIAVLVFGGSFGFMEYRHVKQQRAGEAAKQQVFLALRITSAKLNHVLERVKTPQAP